MKRLVRSMLSLFALLAIAGLLAGDLTAQTLGEIAGVVSDSTGAVIVGAKVTATNPTTNAFARQDGARWASWRTPGRA